MATRNRFWIRDDQQRINHLLKLGNTGFSGAHTALTFKVERLGDDADGQDAHLAGGCGDDRRCTGAGAAAHTCGDEHHVGAREVILDFVDDLLRSGSAHIGLRPGAEALGDLRAHLHDAFSLRHGEGLCIGVSDDEVHPLKAGGDHVVDGIAARAADTENGDTRLQLANIGYVEIDGHGCLSITRAWGLGLHAKAVDEMVRSGL